ncbi:hypothetical protein [Flaviaesturariibacter terrae]
MHREEAPLSHEESLQLITEMIDKSKRNFHETGTSAILWGSVIALCGLLSFAQMNWHFSIGFDVWILTLVALVPQLIISIRESRRRTVLTHTQEAMNAVWMVYGLSIFALVFYFNVVPGQTERLMLAEGTHVFQRGPNNEIIPFHVFVPSAASLLLLLYGIPTLATALAQKFRPMLYGALLCYALFVFSCYTVTKYDYLFNGIAGIANWLVPGLILRARYLRKTRTQHV